MNTALILKGTARTNGDGWKDTTKVGQTIFVWNQELPPPHEPGQYLRVGSLANLTASNTMFEFIPATVDEIKPFFNELVTALNSIVQIEACATMQEEMIYEMKSIANDAIKTLHQTAMGL